MLKLSIKAAIKLKESSILTSAAINILAAVTAGSQVPRPLVELLVNIRVTGKKIDNPSSTDIFLHRSLQRSVEIKMLL